MTDSDRIAKDQENAALLRDNQRLRVKLLELEGQLEAAHVKIEQLKELVIGKMLA